MTDRLRVAIGVAFLAFGGLAMVIGGGAYAYAWYSALAWSQSDVARQVERAAAAPPPIWLDDDPAPTEPTDGSGLEGSYAVDVASTSTAATPLGAAAAPGDADGPGGGTGGASDTTGPAIDAAGAAAGPPPLASPQFGPFLEDGEPAPTPVPTSAPRRAAANDVTVADVDFRFLDPPEPGAHARLQLAVSNRADAPTGPVSVTIPARWFESFDVLGAVPAVLLDRTEQDGRRYFDYPAVGPGETVTLELHVLASNEDLDAPEVRVVLRDEQAEIGRAQPRTVAPKPRPGPARWIRIPSLDIQAGVVPTAWEPPEFVVGQIRDSAAVSLGNTVLIGHLRGPSGDVFNRLDRARLGDEVVAISRGVEFRFIVSDIVVLPNDDSSPMLPTETSRLTLMTCRGTWNPFRQDYSHRLWVIAEPPELAEQTIAANRERAARAAEELARIEAEAREAAAAATAVAVAEATAVAEAAAAASVDVAAEDPDIAEAATGPASDEVRAAEPTEQPPASLPAPAEPAAAPTAAALPDQDDAPAPVVAVDRPSEEPDESRDREAAAAASSVAAPATPLPQPAPPALAIREPTPGARVPRRVRLRGELVGEKRPGEHLWLAVRADVEGSRWYLFGQEITPGRGGRWELELELGGPSDIRHEIVIGSVDEPTHALFTRHVREHPGEPLTELPEPFEAQAAVTVVRR